MAGTAGCVAGLSSAVRVMQLHALPHLLLWTGCWSESQRSVCVHLYSVWWEVHCPATAGSGQLAGVCCATAAAGAMCCSSTCGVFCGRTGVRARVAG